MIFPLSEIEKFALSSTDIFPSIITRSNHTEMWMDYVLSDSKDISNKKWIHAYEVFMDYVEIAIKMATCDLVDRGLVK